jgi:hypothetical protein
VRRIVMPGKVMLGELAKFLRSKNAGPFKLTLDIFFNNSQDYERVKTSGVINKELISKLYMLKSQDAISIIHFDQAAAIKITFPRRIASGNIGDSDIYGAQQHVPLYEIEIPWG